MMTTRTITLPADQWEAILEAVQDHWDEGPRGEGWQSSRLSAASAALSTALAEPEPEGVSDDQALADFTSWLVREIPPGTVISNPAWWAPHIARAILTRYARPAIEPVPVSERLPEPEDCDESGLTCNGGGWCWWFEQSSQMWVADFYSSHYTHWLPAHALPVPTH